MKSSLGFLKLGEKLIINRKVPQQIPEKSEKVGKKAVDTVTPLLVMRQKGYQEMPAFLASEFSYQK